MKKKMILSALMIGLAAAGPLALAKWDGQDAGALTDFPAIKEALETSKANKTWKVNVKVPEIAFQNIDRQDLTAECDSYPNMYKVVAAYLTPVSARDTQDDPRFPAVERELHSFLASRKECEITHKDMETKRARSTFYFGVTKQGTASLSLEMQGDIIAR
jgi:hypothetical protein